MRSLGLDHVSVTVADLDRSIRFYGDLLGLQLTGRGEGSGPEMERITGLLGVRFLWAEFDLGASQVLELIQYLEPPGAPLQQRINDPGSGHIGIRVDDGAAFRSRLLEAGVPVGEQVQITEAGDWHGVRVAYVTDPDGVTVELVQR